MKMLGGATTIICLVATGAAQAEDIKIGMTPGPHAQILEQMRPIAAARGLNIDIIEFSDYVVPNQALAAGDIQADSFQHQPYLNNQNANRGYDLVSIAKTVVFPFGTYFEEDQEPGRAEGRRFGRYPERSDQWRLHPAASRPTAY